MRPVTRKLRADTLASRDVTLTMPRTQALRHRQLCCCCVVVVTSVGARVIGCNNPAARTGREELERDDTADEKPRDGDRPSAGRWWCTTGADGGCVFTPQMIAVLTETIRREVGIAVAQEIAKLSRGEASADAGGASAGLGLRSSHLLETVDSHRR
ncbi:unnamed protein product [Trichogramma brassicae]|uniref:Uncharacterized protein n=1 Tax=Trichogramma brassicae TaxID=86971 RepID=A0A6H5IEN0_9HYME|nr:unnamed protein product [Trichogramma brassicae]